MNLMSTLLISASLLSVTSISLAASTSDAALQAAQNHPIRSASSKARDAYRHPVETLSFFEITPTSTVVEISPGSGWYTEILAPLLKDQGKYYAAHNPANSSSEYSQRALSNFKAKLAADPVYNKVVVTEFAPVAGQQVAPAASADVVVTFRNLHNWYMQKGDESLLNAYRSFFAALKPGGVLGVVEHRLPDERLQSDWKKSGYMPQELVVRLAEQAGFVLEATNEINANPKDKADYPNGVWTLPPTLTLKDTDRAKYLAIGESDRMTLKFRKPLKQ